MDNDEIKDYELDEDTLDEGSGYRVKLDSFEGPLDLLLHLIKRAKIRLCDIFISDITGQFLEFIEKDIDSVDLDKASEFLGMAAYLLEIKAKALLPKPEVAQGESEEDDGSELIRRLEEYELYKSEMDKLKARETVDTFSRAPYLSVGDERTVHKDMTMEGLFEALKKLFERAETRTLDTTPKAIARDPFTVEEKQELIIKTLTEKSSVHFDQLFGEDATKSEIITTFQALLELMKLQFLTAKQEEVFGDIYLVRVGEESAATA